MLEGDLKKGSAHVNLHLDIPKLTMNNSNNGRWTSHISSQKQVIQVHKKNVLTESNYNFNGFVL